MQSLFFKKTKPKIYLQKLKKKIILKFIQNGKETKKQTKQKKVRVGGLTFTSLFQNLLQSYNNQDNVILE